MTDLLQIDYRLAFDDGEVVTIEARLRPDSLELVADPPPHPAPWTGLSCNQCPVCCLPGGASRSCPVAVNVSGLVDRFSRRFSYDHVNMQVTTEERTVGADTTLQAALSSLTGIFMVTSGCPVMDKLRPMVRFHLPLATDHETIYRASTMYLLGQFFRAQDGMQPDWSMKGLDYIYSDVHKVNRAFARRIREAAEHDANANALVRLDLFTGGVSESTRASLADLRYLYSVASLPGPEETGISHRADAGLAAPAHSMRGSHGNDGLLARAAEALPFLIEHSSDVIMLFTSEMNVEYVSPSVERILGLSADQFLNTSAFKWVHPDDVEVVRTKFAHTATQAGVSSPIQLRIRHANGSWVWFEVEANNLLSDPAVKGIVLTARDVTDRRQRETEFLLADRMAAMGVLAASVAHDVNNALACVLANQDFVRSELGAARSKCTDPDVMRHLRTALEALTDATNGAQQIRKTVRDLKTFSRVDDGEPEIVDIRRPIETAINLAWNEIRHRARLVKELAEVPYVVASEAHLVQVFLNLLVNAAQAISDGGADANQIRIVTRPGQSGEVTVEIHDTGAGIPPDVCGRLFEPFFTTKAAGVGTGLGLSISRSIVRSLGGEITVSSEVGRGTVFRVQLPGTSAPATTTTTTVDPRPPDEEPPARIMVIDDEPMMGTTIERLLGGKHHVVFAASGKDALRVFESGDSFDVVLCDVMMPEMPAWKLFEEMERHVPEMARRTIFITSGAFTNEARDFLGSVSNPCLEKPLDIDSLRRSIGGLAARSA